MSGLIKEGTTAANVEYAVVSESGASIYSVTKEAQAEFPFVSC